MSQTSSNHRLWVRSCKGVFFSIHPSCLPVLKLWWLKSVTENRRYIRQYSYCCFKSKLIKGLKDWRSVPHSKVRQLQKWPSPCLRSKRSRTSRTGAERNKGPRESFCIQDARKMGREQKKTREKWGESKKGPSPLPRLFCSRPIFPTSIQAKIASRGPLFRSARTGTQLQAVTISEMYIFSKQRDQIF